MPEKTFTKPAKAAVVLSLLIAGSIPAFGQDQSGATLAVGMLTCTMKDVSNVIVFAEETFDCTYLETNGNEDKYYAQISKLGVNLEYKKWQVLKWAVFAPATFSGAGILEGGYVGASAEVSLGGGVGGRVMVGGSRHQISLQPVSVSAQSGVGASVTLDNLKLTYAPSCRWVADATSRRRVAKHPGAEWSGVRGTILPQIAARRAAICRSSAFDSCSPVSLPSPSN